MTTTMREASPKSWLPDLFSGTISGALTVTHSIAMAQLFQSDSVVLWLPGLIIAFVLLVALRLYKGVLVLPSVLLAAVVLFYFALWISDISLAQAGLRGMLLGPFAEEGFWRSINIPTLIWVDWQLLARQAVSVMTIMFVVAISLLFNATGLELVTASDIDLDQELRAAGIGNIAAGLGCGMMGYQFLGYSVLNSKAGARSRIAGLLSAAFCAATLLLGAPALTYFPKPVVGGLVLFLGFSFLIEANRLLSWPMNVHLLSHSLEKSVGAPKKEESLQPEDEYLSPF